MEIIRRSHCCITLLGCVELMLLLLARTCQGTFECLCTTPECQSRDDIICHTDSMCYVQYTPTDREPTHQDPPEESAPLLVHGCIEGRTPLLCENQRPKFYGGSWPVMYCCHGDLCNKNVIPTLPSWVAEIKETSNKSRSVGEDDGDTKSQSTDTKSTDEGSDIHQKKLTDLETDNVPHEDDKEQIDSQPDDNPRWRIPVNPLYIGVPVAGGCVLLAIIIFAIYILRRQNQIYEEQYLRTHTKQRPSYINQDGSRYVTLVTRSGQPFLARCHNGCLYAESEGSSNGSESRLLAQV